jgi:hypothetical protein
VQQRASGGTWRTLLGLADFAIVQSYLSTAAKWGIDALDALTRLFTDGPLAPALIRTPVAPQRTAAPPRAPADERTPGQ